ncbi:endonuclease/exonuclease/phosphatase family protein [Amycolatopsis kentuckyensis]|uniref:endonuclease/exonuclease/phosphatase family protein n=1 Tax=Amycolatopsis kentuckyensis TaxID=218823 RepID=UPI0035654225
MTANLKRAGYDYKTRRHSHDLLAQMLSTLEEAPHVLCLSECSFYDTREYLSAPLFEAMDVLDSLWGTTEDADGRQFSTAQYTPFLSKVAGSVNAPGLFVDRRYVRPVSWYPHDWRTVLSNSLVASVNGHDLLFKCVHWSGSKGPTGFDEQAALDAQLAPYRAILAGDFNTTTSDPREHIPDDWGKLCDDQGNPHKKWQKGYLGEDGVWRVYTKALDGFFAHGWKDAGAQADDFTTTVYPAIDGGSGLRIDRIVYSNTAPITLVPGSYKVHAHERGARVSDHMMVEAHFDVAPAGGAA